MLVSALSTLGDRLDSKFLTAYRLPAFVAVLGAFGSLAVLVGAKQLDVWVSDLDSVEQTLAVVLIVLAITMIAFVLRALSRPIVKMFAGVALPRAVAEWSTRGQLAVSNRAARRSAATPISRNPWPRCGVRRHGSVKRSLATTTCSPRCSAMCWRRRPSIPASPT